ncbi:hypothetical protein P3X46_002571 [Hevea brasiliensis]|uniref:Rapid ALkalinization Factor n=1 Tax=Hevea brasiliensis TaxID=3981 RepID=A0ABQ9N772_HEVBR|nr:hypothetical protein P3X46_002571 [Hevea brasiliensis]
METRKRIFWLCNLLPTLLVTLLLLHKPTSQCEVSAENGQCIDPMLESSEIGEEDSSLESSRRILPAMKYISPGALRADQPVCGKAGGPYSGCLPLPSNRYNRGCANIYMCRH